MKRFKWLSIVLVLTVSIAFVFAGQQDQEKTDKKAEKKIKRSCDEALIGLEALKALEALEDLKIDLSGLDRLRDLDVMLEGLEALETLKDFDMDINMEGLALAMESLKVLEHMDLHFDFDDFNFDWDDFDFDFDFDFDWIKDLDWDWEDEGDRDDRQGDRPEKTTKKIKKSKK